MSAHENLDNTRAGRETRDRAYHKKTENEI